jgi:predicted nucleotidyltransferase
MSSDLLPQAFDETSRWRIALARKIAPIYAAIPEVSAVVLIGGLARGRGDRYSDLDLAVFWDRAPSEAERRAAQLQFAPLLGTPVVLGELAAIPVFDHSDLGVLWEEAAFIGRDAATGFKIDVNHRTVAAMEHILEEVAVRRDTHPHRLEVLYSIRRAIVLHGADLITRWQAQAAIYPDALARKLVTRHLSRLRANLAMHIYRGEMLPFYQGMAEAQTHLLGALLALNRIYPPELKRVREICDEMALKPDGLAERLNRMLREAPTPALQALIVLVEEVFVLIEQHLPQLDLTQIRAAFYAARQPFDAAPLEIA